MGTGRWTTKIFVAFGLADTWLLVRVWSGPWSGYLGLNPATMCVSLQIQTFCGAKS